MTTIRTGNRRALRRQGGPLLGRRRLRDGTTIETTWDRRARMYFQTIVPARIVKPLEDMQSGTRPTMPLQEIVRRGPSTSTSHEGHERMRNMFRNPGDVEIIVVGQQASPMDRKTRRVLQGMGMDTSAID